MPRINYPVNRTGLLLVDPYNDFLSEGGKLWPQIRQIAESIDLIGHMRTLLVTTRRLGIAVFYVPHRRSQEGDYDNWRYPSPMQLTNDRGAVFADGTWGADWHPDFAPEAGDIIVQQHWGQNGFIHTDLDLQLRSAGSKGSFLPVWRQIPVSRRPHAMPPNSATT